jgi:O-antigen/teichoic acid export membrane protein
MKFLRSFSYTFLTKLLSMVLLLISKVILARVLGPADLGSFGNALNLTTLIARWGSFGIVPATQFISGKYADSKKEILAIATASSLGLGILNMLLIYVFRSNISEWHFVDDQVGMHLFEQMTLCLPILLLSMALPIILLGKGNYKAYATSQLLPLAGQTVILSLALLGTVILQIAVLAQITYWLLMAVISWIQNGYTQFFSVPDAKLTRTFLRKAISMLPLVMLQYGIARFTILIGSHYLSREDLGYYILASNIAETFIIVYTAITPIIFNRTIAKRSDLSFLVRVAGFSNFFMVIVFLVMLWIGKPVFLYLFGSAYDKSWPFLLLLFPGIIMHGVCILFVNHLIASEKNLLVLWSYLAGLVTLIASCNILCAVLGVKGLCLASVLTSFVTMVTCILLIRKRSGNTWQLHALFMPSKQDLHNFTNTVFRRHC